MLALCWPCAGRALGHVGYLAQGDLGGRRTGWRTCWPGGGGHGGGHYEPGQLGEDRGREGDGGGHCCEESWSRNVSLFLIFHCSDCRTPHYLPLPTFSCLRKSRHSLIPGLALVSVEGRLEGRLFCKWSSIPSLPFENGVRSNLA